MLISWQARCIEPHCLFDNRPSSDLPQHDKPLYVFICPTGLTREKQISEGLEQEVSIAVLSRAHLRNSALMEVIKQADAITAEHGVPSSTQDKQHAIDNEVCIASIISYKANDLLNRPHSTRANRQSILIRRRTRSFSGRSTSAFWVACSAPTFASRSIKARSTSLPSWVSRMMHT